MNKNYCGKDKSHALEQSLWETLYDQGAMYNGTQKEYIIGQMFPGLSKSRPRGTILQQCTIWYPIKRRCCMLKMVY